MFFKYDTVIDVGNVTQFTITDLVPGKIYYLAATAYADPAVPQQESYWSIELVHRRQIVWSSISHHKIRGIYHEKLFHRATAPC